MSLNIYQPVNRTINLSEKSIDEINRDNLLTIFKLVSKEIMDSSLVHGRLLDDNFVPLQQLFTVLEHIFLFGLKG